MTVTGTITGDCRFIFLLSWTIKQHVTREASFFMIKETPHFRRCLLPHIININPVNTGGSNFGGQLIIQDNTNYILVS